MFLHVYPDSSRKRGKRPWFPKPKELMADEVELQTLQTFRPFWHEVDDFQDSKVCLFFSY